MTRPLTLLVVADVAVPEIELAALADSFSFDALVSLGDLDDLYLARLARRFATLPMIAVRGNHDAEIPLPAPFINLHGQTLTVAGRIFGGLEGCCRYRPDAMFQLTQEEAATVLAVMPRVDVLICHNSPRGIHEPTLEFRSVFPSWLQRKKLQPPVHHTGFTALRDYCDRQHPTLVLHGHQHIQQETVLPDGTRVAGIYGAARVMVA